jgi:hypothetical protein
MSKKISSRTSRNRLAREIKSVAIGSGRVNEQGGHEVRLIINRVVADRDEEDACQANTPGCCIDHDKDHGDCEGW